MKCYCPSPVNSSGIACGGDDSYPCGDSPTGFHNAATGVQLCCASGDTCGANSLCKYDISAEGHPPLGSGYYLGGCTDPTFKDPICRSDCQSSFRLPTQDVTYDYRTQLWSCCGQNASAEVDCTQPVREASFQAYPPEQFPGPTDEALKPAPTTTLGSPSISSAVQSGLPPSLKPAAPTDTNESSDSANDTTNLSTGAKAGIGIGTAAGALIVFGLVIALVLRFRRIRKDGKTPNAGFDKAELPADKSLKKAKKGELEGDSKRPKAPLTEMEAAGMRHELES